MKSVDSQALGLVNRALGLTGAGAPLTEFLDGTVEQTLDIAALVRRGRTQAGTTGIYYGTLLNNHAAANTQISGLSPYLTPVGALPPYPSPMPAGFDIWILAAAVQQISGSGTFTGALSINTSDAVQGWGIDEAGAAVTGLGRFPLVFWDSVVTQTTEFGLTEAGQPLGWIGLRLLRTPANDSSINFSSTSSAAAVFRCQILLGVFPIGLGQDIVAGK